MAPQKRKTIALRATEERIERLDFLVGLFRERKQIGSMSRQAALEFLIDGKYRFEVELAEQSRK